MGLYRSISLLMAFVFAGVGMTLLVIPGQVLAGFNTLSRHLAMAESPVASASFYLALAVGYMYLVTVLAVLMYRHPGDSRYPLLLAHGKLASSLLSLGLFLARGHYLICLANSVIDASIGVFVTGLYLKLARRAG